MSSIDFRLRGAGFHLCCLALLLAPSPAEGRGGDDPQWHVSPALVDSGDAVDGFPLIELKPSPHTTALVSGKLRVSFSGTALTPAAEERLMRCDKGLGIPAPLCEEPGSEIYFPIDLAPLCPSGDCYLAGHGADPSGSSGRSAIIHKRTTVPQMSKLLTPDATGAALLLAQDGDAMPSGGGATFAAINHVAVGGPYIVYAGLGSGGLSGVYLYDTVAQTRSRVVDSTMPRPRSPGNFGNPTALAIQISAGDWEVAWSDSAGVYVTSIETDVTIEQPIAAGDSYAVDRTLASSFSRVSFWGGTDRLVTNCVNQLGAFGIYSASRAAPGVIARHADGETSIPGGSGNFLHTQDGSGFGDTLFFVGFDDEFNFAGVFADLDLADGPVEAVFRSGNPVAFPGGETRFVGFASPNVGSALASGFGAILTDFSGGSRAIVLVRRALLLADFEEGDFSEWSSHVP